MLTWYNFTIGSLRDLGIEKNGDRRGVSLVATFSVDLGLHSCRPAELESETSSRVGSRSSSCHDARRSYTLQYMSASDRAESSC